MRPPPTLTTLRPTARATCPRPAARHDAALLHRAASRSSTCIWHRVGGHLPLPALLAYSADLCGALGCARNSLSKLDNVFCASLCRAGVHPVAVPVHEPRSTRAHSGQPRPRRYPLRANRAGDGGLRGHAAAPAKRSAARCRSKAAACSRRRRRARARRPQRPCWRISLHAVWAATSQRGRLMGSVRIVVNTDRATLRICVTAVLRRGLARLDRRAFGAECRSCSHGSVPLRILARRQRERPREYRPEPAGARLLHRLLIENDVPDARARRRAAACPLCQGAPCVHVDLTRASGTIARASRCTPCSLPPPNVESISLHIVVDTDHLQ